jgi:hypothetical protein
VVRIHLAVSLRFPGEGSSSQGKSGPKARPKGVVDGKRVNIPVPLNRSEVVTEEGRSAGCRITRFKLVGGRDRQIRLFANPEKRVRGALAP